MYNKMHINKYAKQLLESCASQKKIYIIHMLYLPYIFRKKCWHFLAIEFNFMFSACITITVIIVIYFIMHPTQSTCDMLNKLLTFHRIQRKGKGD